VTNKEAIEAQPPTDTVYAHVERTVHTLRDAIAHKDTSPDGVALLAAAVQALSSWPQFNPMNAQADYEKLAAYEVKRAIKQQGVRISGGTTDSERADVGAAFDVAFGKLAALSDRIAELEGGPR